MSRFMVNLTAVNPRERQRRTPPVEVMVDTGALAAVLFPLEEWIPIEKLWK